MLNPRNRPVTEESKKLINSLLLERLSIAAIGRVSGISETWIQSYAEGKYSTVPQQVVVIALLIQVKTYNRKRRILDNTYACPLQ